MPPRCRPRAPDNHNAAEDGNERVNRGGCVAHARRNPGQVVKSLRREARMDLLHLKLQMALLKRKNVAHQAEAQASWSTEGEAPNMVLL